MKKDTEKGFKKSQEWYSTFKNAFSIVFMHAWSWVVSISATLNIIFIYYFVLLQTTTWNIFLESNMVIYVLMQILSSVLNAILIALGITYATYAFVEKKEVRGSALHIFSSFLFSAAATGCTVCGAVLLPLLGIAASLTALPFGGLEIKLLSIIVMLWALKRYSEVITGKCKAHPTMSLKKKPWLKAMYKSYVWVTPLLLFVGIVYALPHLPKFLHVNFQKSVTPVKKVTLQKSDTSSEKIMEEINPSQGYTLPAKYGSIGPKAIAQGVIDLAKFKRVYDQANVPLTEEQLNILTEGSNAPIHISSENAYFLLNFFWGIGLGNKNDILSDGDMVKYGQGQVSGFASTGGWSLSSGGNVMDYYAKGEFISLSPLQQKRVETVSANIYRPCCNNSTAFPDCNHGMALLGMLELMASQGASEKQMYEAGKYVSAYWFPQNYFDLAVYFQAKRGKSFKDIDAKTILSKDYSSATGWQNIKNWLKQNNLVQQIPESAGGCGV